MLCNCSLTIRSSGPLRRVAVLSCGGQQRPLNSSVRPQRAFLVLVAPLTALWLRPSSNPHVLRLHGSAGLLLAGTFSRANPRRRSRANRRKACASCARCRGSTRESVAAHRLVCVARSGQRRPSPLRGVAAQSSQRYCSAMVAHLVRPNYSFNATVQSFSRNRAPGAAR